MRGKRGGSRTKAGGDAGGKEKRQTEQEALCPLAGHECHRKPIARSPSGFLRDVEEASICAVSSIQRRANGPSQISMQTCTP